jgi:hypothetical protein
VLPFQNIDPDQDYFAESLTTDLSRISPACHFAPAL